MNGTRVLVAVSLLMMAPAAGGTSVVEGQLRGIEGATVLSFVSQYLPDDVQALQEILKADTEAVFLKEGLRLSGEDGQYLSVKVSGSPLRGLSPSNLFLVSVSVEFIEPVRPVRLVGKSSDSYSVATWTRKVNDVVPKEDLADWTRKVVADTASLFAEEVQAANRSRK